MHYKTVFMRGSLVESQPEQLQRAKAPGVNEKTSFKLNHQGGTTFAA
jgi:hypothetical protein